MPSFSSCRSGFLALVLLLTIAGLTVSCGRLDRALDITDQAVSVIDRGIEDISRDSAAWQTVLQRVADELPAEISATIRNDAQNLASRSIASVGTEFRCNVDFLAQRAVSALRRLRAEVLGRQPSPVQPGFCMVVPDAIDLKGSPASWGKVTLHGYDLDQKGSDGQRFGVLVSGAGGTAVPVPEARIGRTTHYQVTLNLGAMARQLYTSRATKLQVAWNGSTDGLPEVVILPWEPRKRQERIDLERTSYMPPHRGGDRDFSTDDDEHMRIDVRGELKIEPTRIFSRVFFFAREERPDWTKVEGWSPWAAAYQAPPGFHIASVRPRAPSRHVANITTHDRQDYSRPAGEVVSLIQVWGDRNGDEAGTWTRVEVHWRPITVSLEETEPEWLH